MLEVRSAERDPLEGLTKRIDNVLSQYEGRHIRSWDDVESHLAEGYGRLLAAEAMCLRLERQLAQPAARSGEDAADLEARRELESFCSRLTADTVRLREELGRFKARGLEARRRFEHAA